MKREHRDFLCNLREELLTQPTDGNRAPRFWGIKERKRVGGFDSEFADGWEVYDGENCIEIGKADNIDSVIREFIDDYGFISEDFAEEHEYFPPIDKTDIEDVVDRANQIQARENEIESYAPYDVVYYRDFYEVDDDSLFLTKKACKAHIDRYRHRYKEPHTYVMTATDCPEYAMLLEILKETDWAKIETGDDT